MPMTPYPGAEPEERQPLEDPAEDRARWRRAMRVGLDAGKRDEGEEKENPDRSGGNQ